MQRPIGGYELLDSIGQAVVATELDSTVIYWNDAATTLFGWTADEALGQRTTELFGTGGSPESAAVLAEIAAKGSWTGEIWTRRRDGTQLPLWITASPVLDEEGEVVAIVGVSSDISARLDAELTRRKLAAIVESSTEAILSKTPEGIITTWNAAAERLYGYSEEEAVGQHVSLIVPEDRHDELAEILAKIRHGSHIERFQTVRSRRDGSEARVMLTVWPLVDSDGQVVGATTVAHDLSERLAAIEEREEAEVRFQAAFRRSPIGILVADLDGSITAVNPSAVSILGRPLETLVGRPWTALIEAAAPLGHRRARSGADSFRGERRIERPDGTQVWLQVDSSLVRNQQEEPLYSLVQLQDVTERKLAELELEHRALHDDLTGLPNRALLSDRLEHALASARRTGGQVGVVFLDLDGFKNVNDVLGHDAGDHVLSEVARRLSHSVRPADTVARFGGDEFVLVCENVTVHSMDGVARRIATALARPHEVDNQEISFHASVGMTMSRSDSTTQALLSEADAAMYRAKELGRSRTVMFDDSLRARAESLLEGERSIAAGIAAGEFVAYFQPIVEIASQRPVGVEALVRRHTAQGGVVMPGEFIGLAESTGLIVGLGESVLLQSVEALSRWRRDGIVDDAFFVAVNLSARQLNDQSLVGLVAGALSGSDVPGRCLHLEITETAVMEELGESVAALHELKVLGVRLAIDDFGTGYSSLAYLHQLPVDNVKIDQSFVSRLGTGDVPIVRAVVGLGKAMGLRCIAEGVETTEQHRVLAELGCELGQGFLWSPALEPADAAAWLAERR